MPIIKWANSAIMGQPPNNGNDALAIKYLLSLRTGFTVPFSKFDPSKGMKVVQPPPGYKHEYLGGPLLAGASFLIAFTVLITALRICVRLKVVRLSWGMDDWMAIPAAFFTILHCTTMILQIKNGAIGEHTWETTYTRNLYASAMVPLENSSFYIATGFEKLTICFFIRRIVAGPHMNPAWTKAMNILTVVLIGYTICGAIIPLFTIGDTPRWWTDPLWAAQQNRLPKVRRFAMNWAIVGLHVGLDVVLLIFGACLICKVRASMWKKIRLLFMFSGGVGSAICSIMRNFVGFLQPNLDPTRSVVIQDQWFLADIGVAMLVINLPALNPLFYRRSKESKPSSGNESPAKRRTFGAPKVSFRFLTTLSLGFHGHHNMAVLESGDTSSKEGSNRFEKNSSISSSDDEIHVAPP